MFVLKFISNNLEEICSITETIFFPKHADCLIRMMKNNSVVVGKQPAGTPGRDDEE